MKNKTYYILSFFVIITMFVSLAMILYDTKVHDTKIRDIEVHDRTADNEKDTVNHAKKLSNKCYSIENYLVKGASMSPLIKDGATIEIFSGWYNKCGSIAKIGDIVSYNYGGSDKNIIKQVKATYKNNLEIKNHSLYIDGIILKNSIGKPYNFSQANLNIISMYIKDGKIPKNSCFIFGDNTHMDSIDSRVFGVVSQKDFNGKINY